MAAFLFPLQELHVLSVMTTQEWSYRTFRDNAISFAQGEILKKAEGFRTHDDIQDWIDQSVIGMFEHIGAGEVIRESANHPLLMAPTRLNLEEQARHIYSSDLWMALSPAKIRPSRVQLMLEDCLFNDGEDSSKHVAAQGVHIQNIGFHPERLEKHRFEISALLDLLPNEFRAKELGGGDGWSFLQACNDKNGNQWGEHKDMEALLMLGQAIGRVEWLLPRNLWCLLPHGMPYLRIKNAPN
jgi:hypothetical protein